MSRAPLQVGPFWPPVLSAYDHMSTYAKPDWAWEGIRRNPLFQADAVAGLPDNLVVAPAPNGVLVTRMLSAAQPATQSWGVRPFRRSATGRARGADRLASRGRHASAARDGTSRYSAIRRY